MNKATKQRFNAALYAEAKAKYPNIPDHCRSIQKYSDSSTNGLTKCVIKWIQLNGYQAERISTSGRYLDTKKVVTDVIGRKAVIGSGKWIPGSGTTGSADISATIKGRSVKIEIKFGNDRQSDAQRLYQAAIEAAGGSYIIVRNMDEFVLWFDEFIK